jgi:hypothetical protein
MTTSLTAVPAVWGRCQFLQCRKHKVCSPTQLQTNRNCLQKGLVAVAAGQGAHGDGGANCNGSSGGDTTGSVTPSGRPLAPWTLTFDL